MIPKRSFRWLWKSEVSIPQNYFQRLTDTGCRLWGVREVRAVILLLAGYTVWDVAAAASNALRRRGEVRRASELLELWMGKRVLYDWTRRIRDADAGPNHAATIQTALAHRDALIPLRDRALWIALRNSEYCFIRKDLEVSDGMSCSVAKHSRVRFACA